MEDNNVSNLVYYKQSLPSIFMGFEKDIDQVLGFFKEVYMKYTHKNKEAKEINLNELIQILSFDPQTKLVDVFDHNHYEAEHIKGAISLPLSEINENAKRLLKPDETIITYCANLQCPASTKAAQDLLFLGFKNVLNYKGGLTEYKRANLPLEGYWHIIDNVIFD
jgi:rhodanese-related sulfurtransferase